MCRPRQPDKSELGINITMQPCKTCFENLAIVVAMMDDFMICRVTQTTIRHTPVTVWVCLTPWTLKLRSYSQRLKGAPANFLAARSFRRRKLLNPGPKTHFASLKSMHCRTNQLSEAALEDQLRKLLRFSKTLGNPCFVQEKSRLYYETANQLFRKTQLRPMLQKEALGSKRVHGDDLNFDVSGAKGMRRSSQE